MFPSLRDQRRTTRQGKQKTDPKRIKEAPIFFVIEEEKARAFFNKHPTTEEASP